MNPLKHSARITALLVVGAVIASCDTRLPTQAGGKLVDDVTRPVITFALSAGRDGTVEQGTPLTVSVTATDSQGVALLLTTVRNAGQSVLKSDSIAPVPAARTTTRIVPVPLAGLANGDKVTIRATATDVSQNVKVDSIVVTVSDTTAPVVAVSSAKAGRTLKGGDTLDVRVTASDSSGIRYAGYRLLKITATDTVRVRSDSAFAPVAGAVTNFTPAFVSPILSDTLPAGSYQLVGFAVDRSSLPARPTAGVSFTLTDASKPASTVVLPTANGRAIVGDSVLVSDSLHDNTALASVTIDAISVRGSTSLGTADTVVRYRAVTAPATGSFRAGLRDTTVQRYLKAVTPLDTLTDSLLIRSVVRDVTGNTSTSFRKIALLPTLAISSTKAGKTVPAGGVVDVRVLAADTVGVATLGYQLFRARATDTVLVSGDSAAGSGLISLFTKPLTLPLNLAPGTYQLRGFSTSVSRPPVVRTIVGPSLTVVDSTPPSVDFDKPSADPQSIGVGESLFVQVRLRDSIGVARVALRAYSVRSRSAGVIDTVQRYTQIIVPGASVSFPPTHDTTVVRYLRAITPIDSVQDSLVVEAVATDVSGFSTRATRRVLVTNGPRASIVGPVLGDSLTRGSRFYVTVHATGSAGVVRYGVRILKFSAWANGIPDTLATVIDANPAPADFTASVLIPDTATPRDSLVLVPFAVDANQRVGTGASFTIAVRGGSPPAPRVTQSIPKRLEVTDSVSITASGDRLTYVGYLLRRLNGTTLKRDSVAASTAPSTKVPLRLDPSAQGQTLTVTGFSRDSANRIGYAVGPTILVPNTDSLSAVRDTTLIVYGHTFALPRTATASDVTVDTAGGSVYVSNTSFNRLERWTAVDSTFDRVGVAVGALPWGMSIQNDGDTLLVANSGGTNISKVCINAARCGAISEVISQRILTRNTYVYTVTETKDENGKIRLSAAGPFSYSDRPQYVAQSRGGRVFYSTRPTSFAPAGTIRWLDPRLAVPDPRQIHSYAASTSDAKTFAIFNSDSIKIYPAPANSSFSDQLAIFDHIYGTATGGSCQVFPGDPIVPNTICGRDSTVVSAAFKVNQQGADIEAVNNIDVATLGLTDTTFVTSSGDRTRVAFGEGNTKGGVGRVIVVDDPNPAATPGPFSPNVTVRDLLENASEAVFGLGLDKHGSSAVVHGTQSYFASVDNPFHLRLQGIYDTFDQGAGIAFHPDADIGNPPRSGSKTDQTRTAFVASSNGSIEVVDAGFYVSRGTLAVKGSLYGPLRATNRFPTDPADVVLKLFGLTSQGLVVINLRASDIKDAP